MKVVLILVDGMRPDALAAVPKAQEIMKKSSYCLNTRTVMPSVTLPCHMSLFHSVDPIRHGTTTNTYAPQVRPIQGLCEVLNQNDKKSAFFYNWEELRDLSRPGSLYFSYFCKGDGIGFEKTNDMVVEAAVKYLNEIDVDFAFVYLGNVDAVGHNYGWMGPEYMRAVEKSWENIASILQSLSEDYTVIITADHGGHERFHGSELPEDMNIPVILMGKAFEEGRQIQNADIKDIAPTVTALLGVNANSEWEGKSLL